MYFQFAALCICLPAQELICVLRLLIEWMILVICINTNHFSRSNKASHVVNVSVGFVWIDTVFYPDHFICIQIIFEDLLWTAIFSILIIIEDVIVIFNFDNYGVTGIHITNRSFTENLMSIYFVYTALRILVPHLRSLMISEETDASAGNTGVQALSAERETPLDSDSESQTFFLDDVLRGSLDGVADAEQDTEDQEVRRGAAFRSPDGTAVPAAETGAFSDQADYSKFYLFSRDYQLTPREQHILQLLLENKTNVEIADDLCISIGTAKAHVHNIFAKVEVKKRQQLLDIYGHYNPTDTV